MINWIQLQTYQNYLHFWKSNAKNIETNLRSKFPNKMKSLKERLNPMRDYYFSKNPIDNPWTVVQSAFTNGTKPTISFHHFIKVNYKRIKQSFE